MFVLPLNTRGSLVTLSDDARPSQWSAASARPRLVRSSGGKPMLRLDRWVLPPASSGAAPVLGGRLTLTVDVSPLPAEISAANLSLSAVQPFDWRSASISLSGPLFGPVETEVAIAAGATGVIALDLNEESAAILASLLTQNVVSPLQVIWKGSVLVRLPAIEIIATASLNRTIAGAGAGWRQVARSLIEGNARIDIRGASNPDLEAAFRDWALNQLTKCLEEGRELSVRASAAQVVEWPIHLATTLDDLLTDAERHELVKVEVISPGEIGALPPVELRVLGAFGNGLERVDVQLTPAAGVTKDVAVTSDAPVQVSLGTGTFTWSYRVKWSGQSASEWSAPKPIENSYSLLISIPNRASLSVELLSSGIDFEHRWTEVRVLLDHQGAPADAFSTALVLDAAHGSALWQHDLTGNRGKVLAHFSYISRQGQTVDVAQVEVSGEQLVITDPLASAQRQLSLLPAGNGWGNIAIVMVDLRYRDGNYVSEESVELTHFEDLVTWTTPARVDGPREVDWRLHASFHDGRFEENTWQTTTSDVLPILLRTPATRDIQVVPIYFDNSKTPHLTLVFRSSDREITQEITNKSAVTVTLPAGAYTWRATWTLPDSSTRQAAEQTSDDEVIVVPRVPA